MAATGTDALARIRAENAADRDAIRNVLVAAFGQPGEADLVERLRAEDAALLALVAEIDGRAAGHVLFSRMWIDTADESVAAAALAPLAVHPSFQRRGLGAELVRAGLARLRERGEEIAIVVGDPAYYSRFGFSVEQARPLSSPFPAEYFAALEMRPGALDGVRGAVRYAAAFAL